MTATMRNAHCPTLEVHEQHTWKIHSGTEFRCNGNGIDSWPAYETSTQPEEGVKSQGESPNASAVNPMTLNPSEPFEAVVMQMVRLNRKKRHDYVSGQDPLQNFIESAQQVNDSAGKSIETMIATKQARLRSLLFTEKQALNESVIDTLLDRAVYSVLAVMAHERGLY